MVHPMVIALYANSGLIDGQWSGLSSRRAVIWETTDPKRTRLPDVMYRPGATFRDYVAWSLKAPMLFIHRNEAYVDCRGLDFETFIASGFNGAIATIGDYALHLSTLFPDVRLKHFLDIRGADMGSRSDVLSLPALFKGLFYGPKSLGELDALFAGVEPHESRSAALSAAREGLDGMFNGRSLASWAEDVLNIARAGLRALEPDALPYLDSLWKNAHERQARSQSKTMSVERLLRTTQLF